MTDSEPVEGSELPAIEAGAVPADEAPREIPPAAAAPRRRRWVLPVVVVAIVIVLAGAAGVWVWLNPELLAGGGEPAANAELTALRQQMQDVTARVAKLDTAPKATVAAPPPAVAVSDDRTKALEARIAALEQRPAAAAPAPPASAASAEVSALRGQLADDSQKLAALSQTVAALSARLQGNDSQTAAQLQALQGKLDSADKLSVQIAGLSARAARTTQITAATAALAAGKPLGTIADAPPALTRFALAAPPTEAALRLQFPELAAQALAAAGAQTGGKPFVDRVWARMQQAVTIRAGTHVLVGNPAAATLASAQDALDAGDLAGAVTALKGLPADAAAPLASWIDQASALLAARAALADLAARA